MAEEHDGGLQRLARVARSLGNPSVHVVDPRSFLEVPTPPGVAALVPRTRRFNVDQIIRPDRGAFMVALVRARRLGTATVDVRLLPEAGTVRLSIVDLRAGHGAVAILFSEPTGASFEADGPHRSDGTVLLDVRGVVIEADDTAHRLLRRDRPLTGTSMLSLVHEDDRDGAVLAFAELADTSDGVSQRRVRLAVDDGWRWFGVVVRLRAGGASFVCSIADVEEEVSAVEALRESEARFRSLAESIPLGVFHMGPDGRIRYANDEFQRITGLGHGDGDTFSIIVPEDVEWTVGAVERFVEAGDRLDIVHGISHPVTGDVRRIRVLAHAIRATGGGALEIVGSVEDVTEREAFSEQLVHEATHDALTGLTNRSAFLRAAEERLAHRPAGSEVAVLFIDLDGFKALNDSGGHRTGDLVLTAIAARLRNSVRTGDLVGRIGGDEFVVLTDVVGGPDGVLGLAHRLCREVEEPLAVGAASVQVRASIGVALSRPSVTDVDALLRAADLAMYEAKAAGHGGVCLLDDRILALGERRMQIEADLPLAADRGELSIAYQPVVALDDHATTGAEALMRWQHPVLGAIPPSEFIPIAEQIGEIHRLGHWLVAQALRDLRSIRDGLPGLPAFLVGINLSARQLGVPGFADGFLRTIEDHGFTTDDVVVELTETVLMDATPNAEANICRLADAGVAVTLDDFGTGYSSIDYLTRLPAKGVKLDMSFVRRLPGSPRSCAVATGLGVLCRQLGIDLIAEGVETPELLDEVIRVGATHAQGYLFARPVPAHELVALLADRPDLITDASAAR